MTLEEACRRICGEELRAHDALLELRNESASQPAVPKKKGRGDWGYGHTMWIAAEARCDALAFAVSVLQQTEECAPAIRAFFAESRARMEGKE